MPDWVLKRADEVVNVDVSIETLRERLKQGKIYDPQKIEQALGNFFRKGNLTALRELALRQLATDQAGKAQAYRDREGLDRPVIPEKVMVAMASRGSARTLLRVGSRIAGRLASDWYAVYVETPREEPGRIQPVDHVALADNIRFAQQLGAKVVKLKSSQVADALVEFAEARRHHPRDLRAVGALAVGSARARLDRRSLPPGRPERDGADRSRWAPRHRSPLTTGWADETMKLRTKLLLGYGGFILALGVLGGWSARTLSQMSAVSGRIIAENYDSVVAAQDMKESLERLDSAAVFELLGEHDRASRQTAQHRTRFDAAFDKAAANVAEVGEPGDRRRDQARAGRLLSPLRRVSQRARQSDRAVLPRPRAALRLGPHERHSLTFPRP